MVNDSTRDAALALHRFGLGPRPGTIAAIASDPRGALLAELERPGIGRIDNPELLTSAQAARAAFEARAARQAQQIVAQRAQKEAERLKADSQKMGDDAGQSAATSTPPAQAEQVPTIERQIILKEIKAKLDAAVAAEIGFAERLVWFWSNHFCVSAEKVPNMAGGYEREAIRPHGLGRYVDMVLPVEGHPAMLVYLDNFISNRPNSGARINRTRGLNENLAREILELHTLGVRTGYSQDDVLKRLLPASDDTQMRLLDLYRHTDAKLARAFEGRRDLATLARTGGIETMPLREGEAQPNIGRIREYVGNVASTAAKYLAQPNGPRVGAASFVGWDTHINEGAAGGQLAALLGALDEAIAAIEKTMADAWSETVIAVVTEFGRTARINGTDGTDHGTATVAVLAGGALKGGRVIADWPGLRPADLHEGRDLKPTIDLRAVLKGVLRDHLRVDEVALATSIFPRSDDAKPMAGLLA